MKVYILKHNSADYGLCWEIYGVYGSHNAAKKKQDIVRAEFALKYEEVQTKNLREHGERYDFDYDPDVDWDITEHEIEN